MTDNANVDEARRQKEKALARWESEGGALGPPAPTLDPEDMRVLGRLGAALLFEWEVLSEETRTAIIGRASTLHAERDALRIRQEIARFVGAQRSG